MTKASLTGTILGKYRIGRYLGGGGMGVVYEAEHISMRRKVALKLLPANLLQKPEYEKRFLREVQIAAKLEHPHIVRVYDYGTEKKTIYIVMQLLVYGSLHERLERLGQPSLGESLQILSQTADALDYAHQFDIVHRDVKPNNILFNEEGSAFLADFGIAKVLQESATQISATGQVMGTPLYMPPEQWKGETIDARSDIYALGVVAYLLLTGVPPYQGKTPFSLMNQHISEPLPPPSTHQTGLSGAVDQVIEKSLAKSRDERYASVRQFVDDLINATDGDSVLAAPSGEFRTQVITPPVFPDIPTEILPTPIPPPRQRSLAVIGVTLVFLIIGIGAGLLLMLNKSPQSSALSNPPVSSLTPAASLHAANVTATSSEVSLTPTVTDSPTPTDTPTDTPTMTPSDTPTDTPTDTQTPTDTPSDTPTPTETATYTPSITDTPTPTWTPSLTTQEYNATIDAEIARRQTETATQWTLTPTLSDTQHSQTIDAEIAVRLTETATVWSPTPTATTTPSSTPTLTLTPTPTDTPSPTPIPTLPPENYRLVFGGKDTNDYSIYVLNGIGTRRQQLSFGGVDRDPDVGLDGTTIYFGRQGSPSSVWTVNIDGSDEQQFIDINRYLSEPDVSTDGLSLLLTCDRSSICRYDMETEQLTTLISGNDGGIFWSPTWSPDGTHFSMTGRTEDTGGDRAGIIDGCDLASVFVADANGGNIYRISEPDGGSAYEPDWSPDGTKIAYYVGYGACDFNQRGKLRIYDITTQTTFNLTDGQGWARQPKWSPDGGYIAFLRAVSDTSDDGVIDGRDREELAVIDLNSGQITTADPSDIGHFDPVWVP